LRVAVAVGFVSLAGQLRVPVPGTDVPMTLQSLATLLVGFVLGPGESVAAMAAFLTLGELGLPLFSPGSAGLHGMTGGYLFGFLAAAWLVSVFKAPDALRWTHNLGVGFLGMAAIFVCGVAWRATMVASVQAPEVGVWAAISSGVLPFVGKAAVEVSLAVAIVNRAARLRRRWSAQGSSGD
jgi:biotin transport system substrate-specific component